VLFANAAVAFAMPRSVAQPALEPAVLDGAVGEDDDEQGSLLAGAS
jgi:hypothetical protein